RPAPHPGGEPAGGGGAAGGAAAAADLSAAAAATGVTGGGRAVAAEYARTPLHQPGAAQPGVRGGRHRGRAADLPLPVPPAGAARRGLGGDRPVRPGGGPGVRQRDRAGAPFPARRGLRRPGQAGVAGQAGWRVRRGGGSGGVAGQAGVVQTAVSGGRTRPESASPPLARTGAPYSAGRRTGWSPQLIAQIRVPPGQVRENPSTSGAGGASQASSPRPSRIRRRSASASRYMDQVDSGSRRWAS